MDGNPVLSTDPATGDMLLDQSGGSVRPQVDDGDHFANLVPKIESGSLGAICNALTTHLAEDEANQSSMIEMMADHVELLGVGPESDPEDLQYEASDTSDSPLLLTALTRFMAKATAAIMPQPQKVCRAEANFDIKQIENQRERTLVKAELDGTCERVEDYYTDYLFYRDQPYQEDTDSIAYECGLHGIGIRKIYNDMSRQRNKTRLEWVPLQNMLISYDARSFTYGRISQKIRMSTSDLIRRVMSGEYEADDIVTEVGSDEADDALTQEQDRAAGLKPSTGVSGTHLIYEVYTDLFLDADPHPRREARPYVITIHQPSQKIVSIKRNWQEGDPEEKRIETFVGYIYFPNKRATQGMGLGHLLANITRTLRKGQRAGFDSAYLQNMPFGWKLSNMSIRNESQKLVPGEFIDVDSPTDDIRSALQMNMFQGPSPGLIQLLQDVKADGKELGGIATIDFSELMKAGVSVAPALAALEESSEFQTSIHARLFTAQQMEMKLLHDRTLEVHGGNPVVYGDGKTLQPGDLTRVDLVPMMKPGFVSKQKAVVEAAALMEAAKAAPDIVDERAATEEYVRALGRSDIDDFLIPPPEEAPPPQPRDPVTEYSMVLTDQPVAAGMSQNHQAHIDTHNSQMRMIETSGMTVEDGEKAMAALAAHIVDHHAKMMLVEVASRIGIDPMMFEQGIPPELEGEISMAIAEATAQIEAERRPPEAQEESKIQIEQVKGQNKMAEQDMKQRHEREMTDLKHQQAMELQAQKDEAEMERAELDDDTALEIARMKDPNKDRPSAGTIST